MSDAIHKDTLDEAANSDTLEQTQVDTGTDEAQELLLGKYKDMEALASGVKASEQKLHSQAQIIKDLEDKAKLTDVISKLAETQANANVAPDTSEEELKAQLAEIAEDFRESPDVAVNKQMSLLNAWIVDEGKKVSSATSKEMAELKATISGMQERMGDMNPDYTENKELVDQLVSSGMPKANAIEYAKKTAPSESSAIRPASMGGSSIRGGEQTGAYLTKEDRASMMSIDGLSKEDCDVIEAEYQQRKAGRGRV